jgi:hypothetical protein
MIVDDSATGQPDSVKLCALIGRWFNDFATRPIEVLPFRNILPLTGFTILHSLRIAYLYHSVLSSQGVKVGRRKQDVSFLQSGLVCTTLVMSGTTMAALLQGQPSGLLSEGSGELVASYMYVVNSIFLLLFILEACGLRPETDCLLSVFPA